MICRGRVLTYQQLEARTNQLAHTLCRSGVGLDSRVGVCLDRSLEMLITLIAVWKAGGAYVPLDPASPAERLALILTHAQAPVGLTQTTLLAKLGLRF